MGDNGDHGETKVKDTSSPRIRRRNRMITSCLECRRRKLKCDKLHPCTNCSKFSRDCMFLAPALDSVSQKKLNELKEKMGSLERVLEDDIARKPTSRTSLSRHKKRNADLPGEDSSSDHESPVPEDEKQLEVTPMAGFDAAYEDGGDEDLLDVGCKIGLLRLTERIGGMFRPRLSEELATALQAPIRRDLEDPDIPNLPDHETEFLAPGPEYIAPGPGFVFGDVGPRRNLIDYLPTKEAADTLVLHYYNRCHFIARCVHWPTFRLQYETFWLNVLEGIEPPTSLQALFMSIMFAAVASMEEEEVLNLFANSKVAVQTNFQTGTELALSKANFMRTTKVDTLQALVIYLIPMYRDEQSRAHSVLAGTAVRLAECIGLHRDPADHFGITAIEAHVRRILWFQICFIDYHSADKQGPRPSIRREDYDTKFPYNVDDSTLMTKNVVEDQQGWTDMTLTRIRFECCEMWRISRADVERLHQKRITITHALGKIESFRRAMDAKYSPVLDTNVPVQRLAKLIMDMSIHRMHVNTLHRYHFAVEVSMPDRLRHTYLNSCTISCEAGMEVWTNPALRDWYWYRFALFSWAQSGLLALEVFTFPQRREADRIWKILDFVFKTETTMARDIKARQILGTIRDRTAYYRSLRGTRIPISMQNRLDTNIPIRNARGHGVNMRVPAASSVDREKSPSVDVKPSDHGAQSQTQNSQPSTIHSSPQLSSPLKIEDSSGNGSWTMDNPYNYFVGPTSQKKIPRHSQTRSAASSISPSAPNIGLPTSTPITSAPTPAHSKGSVTVHDTGQSPSNSSTNTENWPPPITNEHSGWRYAFQTPSPQQKQSQSTHQRHASPHTNSHMQTQSHIHQQTQQQTQPVPHQHAHLQQQVHPQQYPQAFNPHSAQMPIYMPPTNGPLTHIPFVPTPINMQQFSSMGQQDMTSHEMQGLATNPEFGGNMPPTVSMDTRMMTQPPSVHPGQEATMLDINWAEWDKIFPPEVAHGNLDHPDYRPTR